MRSATPEALERAFDLASRAKDRSDPSLPDPLAREARCVLDARREDLAAERCPAPILARVQSWFAARPRGLAARILDLVFDSGSEAVPAVRGRAAPRTLRYAAEGAVVDLQVREGADKGRVLHVAVTPAIPGASFEVRALPKGAPRRVALDASGTGQVGLPARARRVAASVRVGTSESLRIQNLRLE